MGATFAKGTKLEVGDGATPTEAFALIHGIRTITGPTMSADKIDITSHDTPGNFRNHMQGLKDWGMLSFELLWDPADEQHQQLFDDYTTGAVRNYKLTYPDVAGTSLAFAGWVGNNPTSSPFDGALTKTAEIIIMGDPMPTWTPAAAGLAARRAAAKAGA
jgi:predicted secreted protein